MKTKKKPEHWPYVSPAQQFDGFASVAKYMKPKELNYSLTMLKLGRFISGSQEKRFCSWYRNIHGMSYNEWMTAIDKRGAFRRAE